MHSITRIDVHVIIRGKGARGLIIPRYGYKISITNPRNILKERLNPTT
jgi:hypothetical protein